MTEGQNLENETPKSRSLEHDTSDRDGPPTPQAANDPAPVAEPTKKTSGRRTGAQDGEGGGRATPSRGGRPGAKPKSKPRPYNLSTTTESRASMAFPLHEAHARTASSSCGARRGPSEVEVHPRQPEGGQVRPR